MSIEIVGEDDCKDDGANLKRRKLLHAIYYGGKLQLSAGKAGLLSKSASVLHITHEGLNINNNMTFS